MAEIIQLDEDLSPAISALAHSLSAEIDEDNLPSDKFENVANILLNGLLDFPKIKSKLSSLLTDGKVCIWGDNSDQLQILYHATSKSDTGKPHDHGSSWALYFQVSGVTRMSVYKDALGKKLPNESEKIELDQVFDMKQGTGIYFPPGSVHSAAHPSAPAAWIRLTGQDLAKLPRQVYDENTGLKK
ncbi:MAG: hypothetical protein VW162_07460 [Alphaproteobacteria bacterium]